MPFAPATITPDGTLTHTVQTYREISKWLTLGGFTQDWWGGWHRKDGAIATITYTLLPHSGWRAIVTSGPSGFAAYTPYECHQPQAVAS